MCICFVILIGCKSNNTQPLTESSSLKNTVHENNDSDFSTLKTNKLIIAHATAPYTHKTRSKSQFAIDIGSKVEFKENYTIKASKKKVLILNDSDKVIHDFLIQKTWVDKPMHEKLFNLIDNNNVECLFTSFLNSQGKRFLSFRYSRIVETYYTE